MKSSTSASTLGRPITPAESDEHVHRVLANLAGPAGYISMEDTEATELVQRAIESCAAGDSSFMAMGDEAHDRGTSLITEHMIRSFWRGYRSLMGWDA